MNITLSKLLQRFYRSVGQSYTTTATGGSVSTAIDTKLGDTFGDDEWKGGALFVVRDAAGASAAPEGEFSFVSSYVQSTNTVSVSPSLTTAVASGDTIMVTTTLFPLYEMIEIANTALPDIGTIAMPPDTSITTAASQTEYTLPAIAKYAKPLRVEIQGITTDANDNRYTEIHDYDIIPSAGGSAATIVFPQQYPSGYKIRITYEDVHPVVTAYSSYVNESLHPNLALAAFTAHALQWFNGLTGGTDEYWMGRENKAWNDYERARQMFPIVKPETAKTKVFIVGHGSSEDTFTWPDP